MLLTCLSVLCLHYNAALKHVMLKPAHNPSHMHSVFTCADDISFILNLNHYFIFLRLLNVSLFSKCKESNHYIKI